MPTPTKAQLRTQLRRIRGNGFAAKLEQQATAHGFPTTFFFGIASRETNCQNILGDNQHGVGIIQIDIQHPIARQARDSGSWRTNPDPLIAFGANLLAGNIDRARQTFPALGEDLHLKIAASGYNSGIARAITSQREGDSDRRTTGRDYGRDVMARMALFAQLIAEGN